MLIIRNTYLSLEGLEEENVLVVSEVTFSFL